MNAFKIIVFLSLQSLLLRIECGTSFRRSRQPRLGTLGRIIHGKQSAKGAWPWQVCTIYR